MKIKVVVLDKDEVYLSRLANAFSSKYPNKIEIYSFTEITSAVASTKSVKPNVFLANCSFDIDLDQIPSDCSFAYLLDSPGANEFDGSTAICKFQKLEQLYKQILNLYSSVVGNISVSNYMNGNSKVLIFAAPSGGVGVSSMAAACCINFAKQSQKVLYLNLEPFSSTNSFFTADGQFCMSDVIFALKNKKSNLGIKLESYVRRDNSGVYFFSQPKLAVDILELKHEDKQRLISELSTSGDYDYIVLDSGFSLSPDQIRLYSEAQALFLIGDGSEISNLKLFNACKALSVMEETLNCNFLSRTRLLYNKFSKKTSKAINLEDINLTHIGGAPKFENITSLGVVNELSKLDLFEAITREVENCDI